LIAAYPGLALTLHSQDESEVEKEARSPSQAQEKKDESAVVSVPATSCPPFYWIAFNNLASK
jgi:hypothetical protein